MIIFLFLGFVLGAATLLFALQNNDVVSLTFVGYQFSSSLALLVIVAVLVGFVLALLIMLPSTIGDYFRMRKLHKHNAALQNEALRQKQAADVAAARLQGNQEAQSTIVVN